MGIFFTDVARISPYDGEPRNCNPSEVDVCANADFSTSFGDGFKKTGVDLNPQSQRFSNRENFLTDRLVFGGSGFNGITPKNKNQ